MKHINIKTVCILLALIMVVSIMPMTALATDTQYAKDVPSTHPHVAAINAVLAGGVMTVDANGNFRPNDNLTSGAAAVTFNNAFGGDNESWTKIGVTTYDSTYGCNMTLELIMTDIVGTAHVSSTSSPWWTKETDHPTNRKAGHLVGGFGESIGNGELIIEYYTNPRMQAMRNLAISLGWVDECWKYTNDMEAKVAYEYNGIYNTIRNHIVANTSIPDNDAHELTRGEFCEILYIFGWTTIGSMPSYYPDDVGTTNNTTPSTPATPATPSTSTGFTDVRDTDWFADTVKAAAEAGIIAGNTDGTFRPNDTLTFAQAVTFAVRARQYFNNYMFDTNEKIYGAADQTNVWYQIYVDYALQDGLIASVPTDPNQPISRAEVAKIFATFAMSGAVDNYIPDDYFTDVPTSSAAYDDIMYLATIGIMNGKNASNGHARFGYDDTITRAEMATIVSRVIYLVDRVEISA